MALTTNDAVAWVGVVGVVVTSTVLLGEMALTTNDAVAWVGVVGVVVTSTVLFGEMALTTDDVVKTAKVAVDIIVYENSAT